MRANDGVPLGPDQGHSLHDLHSLLPPNDLTRKREREKERKREREKERKREREKERKREREKERKREREKERKREKERRQSEGEAGVSSEQESSERGHTLALLVTSPSHHLHQEKKLMTKRIEELTLWTTFPLRR
jgi:uncharacterized membrane protein YdbT with pleckstrin-like domain